MATDLYPQILVLELIEKTKSCAIIWNKTDFTTYRTQWTVGSKLYQLILTHANDYVLDFSRNHTPIYSLNASTLPNVADLYQIVGILTSPQEDVVAAVSHQRDCGHTHKLIAIAGFLIGGGSAKNDYIIAKFAQGGVIVNGSNDSSSFLPGQGGAVLGGESVNTYTTSPAMSGGLIASGFAKVTPYIEIGYGGVTISGLSENAKRIHRTYDIYLGGFSDEFGGGKIQILHPNDSLETIVEPAFGVRDMFVDSDIQKIFWTDQASIFSCDLNGANVSTLLTRTTAINIIALANDKLQQKIFYKTDTSNAGSIRRCNYDGTEDESYYTPPLGLGGDIGIWANFLYLTGDSSIGSTFTNNTTTNNDNFYTARTYPTGSFDTGGEYVIPDVIQGVSGGVDYIDPNFSFSYPDYETAHHIMATNLAVSYKYDYPNSGSNIFIDGNYMYIVTPSRIVVCENYNGTKSFSKVADVEYMSAIAIAR